MYITCRWSFSWSSAGLIWPFLSIWTLLSGLNVLAGGPCPYKTPLSTRVKTEIRKYKQRQIKEEYMLPFAVSMGLLILIPIDEVRTLAPIVDNSWGSPVFVLWLGVQPHEDEHQPKDYAVALERIHFGMWESAKSRSIYTRILVGFWSVLIM